MNDMAEDTPENEEDSEKDYKRAHLVNVAVNILERERDYQCISVLGKGTYGDVYKVYDPERDVDLAVKIVIPDNIAEMEVTLWPKLQHCNIVPLLELLTLRPTEVAIFIMPVQRKNLHDILWDKRFRNRQGCLDKIKVWMFEVLCALEYIGSKQMCHLDIKVDNILISQKSTAMVCDFSFLNVTTKPLKRYDLGLPYIYRPPEACQSLGSETAVDGQAYDMWGYGIMCTEILTHFIMASNIPDCNCWIKDVYPTLFSALQEKKFAKLLNQTYPADDIDRVEIKLALNFIQSFLVAESSKRILPTAALQHQFLHQGDRLGTPKDVLWLNKKEGLLLHSKMIERIRAEREMDSLTTEDSKSISPAYKKTSNSESSGDEYITMSDDSSPEQKQPVKQIAAKKENISSPMNYEVNTVPHFVNEDHSLNKFRLEDHKFGLRSGTEDRIMCESSESSDSDNAHGRVEKDTEIFEFQNQSGLSTSKIQQRRSHPKFSPIASRKNLSVDDSRTINCTSTYKCICGAINNTFEKQFHEYSTDVHDSIKNLSFILSNSENSCKSQKHSPPFCDSVGDRTRSKLSFTGLNLSEIESMSGSSKRCVTSEFDIVDETGAKWATGDSLQAEFDETEIAGSKMVMKNASGSSMRKFTSETQACDVDVPQEMRSLRDRLSELDKMFDKLEKMLTCENCSHDCCSYDKAVGTKRENESEIRTLEPCSVIEERATLHSSVTKCFRNETTQMPSEESKKNHLKRQLDLNDGAPKMDGSDMHVSSPKEKKLHLKIHSPLLQFPTATFEVHNQTENSESEESTHLNRKKKLLKWLRDKYVDIERVVQRKPYKILK